MTEPQWNDAHYKALLDALEEGVVLLDRQGRVSFANPAAERIFSLPPDGLVGTSALEPAWSVTFADGSPATWEKRPAAITLRTGQPSDHVIMHIARPDGIEMRVSVNARPVFAGDDGLPTAALVSFVDVTADYEAEGNLPYKQFTKVMESLNEAEQRFEMVFERAAVGMNIVSLDGRFLRVNPAYRRLMGYTPEQLSTMTIFEISDPDDIDPTRAQYDDLIAGDIDEYQMDKQLRRADGIWIWARISASIVRDEAGRPLYAIGLVTDITDTRELADRLEHAATHDYLTGLAVRSVLHDHLERSLALARRTNEPVAVLVVDLDGFKMVNDTRGHAAGDAVLIECARRLESLVRATDLVVRLGGDEFVLVLAPSSDPAGAVEIARRIVTALATEFVVAGRKVRIGASVGLAYSLGVESADALLADADGALYRAKGQGRGTFAVAVNSSAAPRRG